MKASFNINGLEINVSAKFKGLLPAPWQTPEIKTTYKYQWVQIPFDSESKRGYTAKAKAEFYNNVVKYPSLYMEKNQPERPFLPAFWEKKSLGEVNTPQPLKNNGKYTIFVSSEHGKASFTFWSSIAKPKIESDSDLLGALTCFVSDATCSQNGFEDFCSEFGYDSDSRKALKIFKACEKANEKLNRIIGDMDIYDFSNAVNELENAA